MSNGGRQHLHDTGMSYGAHLGRASRIGGRMVLSGAACMVHGLLPGIFRDTASRTIAALNEEIMAGPGHKAPPTLLEFEI